MNKESLIRCLQSAKNDYIWTLYFFTYKKQKNTEIQYETYSIYFKSENYKQNYASELIDSVLSFQVEPISEIEDYDGYNTKVSCDKLDTNSKFLCDHYTRFIKSLHNCGSDTKPHKKKYHGYVLDGRPNIGNEGVNITFLKFANPMISFSTKKTCIFKKGENEELDIVDESFYRLYLVTDTVIINEQLYNFNRLFEPFFNMEQTMHRFKNDIIEKIVNENFISNADDFKKYAKSINPRTFLTISAERIENVKSASRRLENAEKHNISLDESGCFAVASPEEAKNLIDYLCFKTIEDAETRKIYHANNVRERKGKVDEK